MKYSVTIFFFCFFSFNVTAQYAWKNTYSYNLINFVNAIDTTSDHGYFIAGGYRDVSSLGNYFAAKLDSNGNEIWRIIGTKYIGFSNDNIAMCIVNTEDGGCLIGGEINNRGSYDLYFIRINSTGQVVWERIWGGAYTQRLGSLIKNGNKYLCTFSTLVDPLINYLLEFNDQGDSLWSKSLTTGIGASSSLIKAANQNYILLGAIKDSINNNNSDLTFSELDAFGNTIYTRVYDDSISFIPQTINQTPDRGFFFSSFNFEYHISKIIKVDSTGLIQWQRRFNRTYFCASTILSENNYSLSTGSFNNSIYVINFDSIGNIKDSDTIPIDELKSVIKDNITDWNGDLLICGDIYDSNSCMACGTSGIVVKVDLNTINKITDLVSIPNSVINIFPNPLDASSFDLTIKSNMPIEAIKITDIAGKTVFEYNIPNSFLNSEFQIHLNNKLSAGTYFILFENNSGYRDSKKLIVFD